MNTISQVKDGDNKVTHEMKSPGVLRIYTKEDTEREWRDAEMLRTDKLVILPDFPRGRTKQSFLDYRQALADYPSQPDFPNGTRPIDSQG